MPCKHEMTEHYEKRFGMVAVRMGLITTDELPETMEAIREGIAGEDANAVERAAHSLKGAVGNFGAKSVFESAYHLEKMGAGGDIKNGGQAFDDLKEKTKEFETAIRAFLTDQEDGS